MATTVKIPLAVLTVQPDSANAFWTTKTGASIDMAHIAYVDSGEGLCTFWGIVPHNVAATPAWNLEVQHHVDSGSGGPVVATFRARATSSNLIDVAPVVVSSAAVLTVNSVNTWTITAVSGGSFDTVVAVSAGNYLFVECNRHGGNSGDTLSAQWNLAAVNLRIDVA